MAGIRLAGMASGMDTDQMVEDLMKAEKAKTYKTERAVTKKEWEIEAYRDVTDKVTKFKNAYMDLLSSTNMQSESYYRDFTTTLKNSVAGTNATSVSVISTSGANVGNHTVEIMQVAKKASIIGEKTTGIIRTNKVENLELEGKSIEFTIDGVRKNIELSNYASLEDMRDDLQTKLNATFGEGFNPDLMIDGEKVGKVSVKIENGGLIFQAENGAENISVYEPSSTVSFKNTASVLIESKSLESLASCFKTELQFGTDGEGEDLVEDLIKFKINDVEFTFDKETSLKDIMNQVNAHEDLDVRLSYSSTSGKFTLAAKTYGSSEKVEIEDMAGNFFEALGISSHSAQVQEGQDTKAIVDGIEIVRNTQTFTMDGITYQANEVTTEPVSVNLAVNADKIYEKITKFVDSYNTLVSELDNLISEKVDNTVDILTEDDKEGLSSEQIEKLEAKAKKGILRNDQNITNMLNELRNCFLGGVEGINKTFSDIGIKTGKYTDKGKIVIDGAGQIALKSAITDDLDSVIALFTKRSEDFPYASRTYTTGEQKTRRNQEGLMHRFSDILDKYVSTNRDLNGKKGYFLEKAGLVGDASEFKNTLTDELKKLGDKMDDLKDKLSAKYERYYAKFAAMESAMNKANSQASYLASFFGGNNQ